MPPTWAGMLERPPCAGQVACLDRWHADEDEEEVGAIPPRAYRKDYIERKGLSKMNARITDGSRRFLEGLAWSLVVAEVSQHPQEAQLGGIPSVVQRVRGFLNIRFKEGGKWHSDLTVIPLSSV